MDDNNMLLNIDNYDNTIKKITKQKLSKEFLIIDFIDKYNILNKINPSVKLNKIFLLILEKYFINNNKQDKSLILAKLCKTIDNDNILNYIVKLLGNQKLELHQDDNKLTAIDYLIYRGKLNILDKLLDNAINLEFINFEENSLFYLIETCETDNIIGLILKIIDKGNVHNIYDKFNNNIILKLLQHFKFNKKLDIKALSSVIDTFDIFEQNIFKDSIYSIAQSKIGENIKLLFKNSYLVDSQLEHTILNPYHINIKFINYNFNPKYLLNKTDSNDFKTDYISATLYYLIMAKQYDDVEICYCNDNNLDGNLFDNKNLKNNNSSQKVTPTSNNNYSQKVIMVFNLNNTNFPKRMPFIMIFDNGSYWLDSRFVKICKKSIKRFVVLKVILALKKSFHANIVIIDKVKKTVERFEPYGDFIKSNGLNEIIIENIVNPLNDNNDDSKYTFIMCSGVGFQSRSDEHSKNLKCRTYINEPKGYCLAWCHFYLEMRINDNLKDIYPCLIIKIINNYIINCFKDDYDIENICQNLFIIFIRYYSKNLVKRIMKLNLKTVDEINNEFENLL